jgi:hypothetical protein
MQLPSGTIPEVLFLGTFNPSTPGNHVDLFYGRNYFWQVMALLKEPRTAFDTNGPRIAPNQKKWPPKDPLKPRLEQLAQLTVSFRMSFADLIGSVLPQEEVEILGKGEVSWQNQVFDLINDDDLAKLDKEKKVVWNKENIIQYLCDNPQIEHIYFTRQAGGVWDAQLNAIRNSSCMKGRTITPIFTPSGSGMTGGYPRRPYILGHWLHNNDAPKYGRLDHGWLRRHGVEPNDFPFPPPANA